MEENNITIISLDPTNFESQEYISKDVALIATSSLDTQFQSSTDYIEFYVFDSNKNLIYPQSTIPLTSFTVQGGDVYLNPISDLEGLEYDLGVYNISYHFYRNHLSSNLNTKYFIKEISSDRTEIRLDSNIISNEDIISSVEDFITYRDEQTYFVDFLLNFGSNQSVIANNIELDTTQPGDPTILIKLYEPLPSTFDVKDELWVVEEVSDTQAYNVDFPFTPFIEEDFEYISGPNFSLQIKGETAKSSELFSYNTLMNSDVTSSVNQIKSLLEFKGININIDYEKFDNFVNFSSAKTRLENFYYKVQLIESLQDDLDNGLNNINGSTQNTTAYITSKKSITDQIGGIIEKFDGYEYFMYFNSGSSFSYPKQNTTPPFTLYPSTSPIVTEWVNNVATEAEHYDSENNNWIYNTIPEYLRIDPENRKYELFMDMVGQHYDNIWVYTKDITNKFNADNRLDYGISKDLVADAIKDFGIKLYSNNFNTEDLYTAFLGITPSGSLFPNNKITTTLPASEGLEYTDTLISASDEIIPLDDVNKRLYKRIYHNIPYLLKTKGTIAGLRALITSYGIPDTILRINEFGGKDRNDTHDWDYHINKYSYALSLDGTNYVSSSFDLNPNFSTESPKTLQFRFKSPGIPSSSISDRSYQTLWVGDNNSAAIVLEYTGSGESKPDYSGSITDPNNIYGTLKFLPEVGVHPEFSASISLPFFNGDWWSVMATIDRDSDVNSAVIHAGNKIGNTVGFHQTSSVIHQDIAAYWDNISNSSFPYHTNWNNLGNIYKPLSGSIQEIRYYTEVLSGSLFEDYIMNPLSFEGNTTNGSPTTLAFRADLGTLRNTGSRTSVHPKVTGSLAYITSSFVGNSDFYVNQNTFYETYEHTYLDQVPAGIKNRITDKITANNHILPEGDTLSPMRSIQQSSFKSGSYTPNINYLEVAFSPQDEINDDIIGQLGYFNLGDYIGDPRDISNNDKTYPALDKLRDDYFKKYIKSYDVVDFVRLMNFFDNSLFRMIKDFTPARTSLSSGVVVKQHLLERNRQRPAQVGSSDETLFGLVKPQSKNYKTGSGDVGQYEANGGSSIYSFTGGTGGSAERYNGLNTSPSASAYGLKNEFELTQSYKEEKEGLLGSEEITVYDQSEFYDGIFSGSTLTVTDKILNPNCAPYLTVPDIPIRLKPIFFRSGISYPNDVFGNTVSVEEWGIKENSPKKGFAFILTEYDPTLTNLFKVTNIKLPREDENGFNISDYIGASDRIEFVFPEFPEATEYIIDGYTVNAGNILLRIKQGVGGVNVISSSYGGSENWNLNVRSNFTASTGIDETSQGVFEEAVTHQEQHFQYWPMDPSNLYDPNNSFNTGSDPTLHGPSLLDPTIYRNGTYNPKSTSNVPWIISASITYESFDTGITGSTPVDGRLIQGGMYVNAGVGYTNQDIFVSPTSIYTLSGSTIYTNTAQNVPGLPLDTNYYFRNGNITSLVGEILFTDRIGKTRFQVPGLFAPVWIGIAINDTTNYVYALEIDPFSGEIHNVLEANPGPYPVIDPPVATGNQDVYSLPTYDNPYDAAIDVDSQNFNINVNHLIPGSSGSGTPIAGNRQIISSGDSELDFHFTNLSFLATHYYRGASLKQFVEEYFYGSDGPSWSSGTWSNTDFAPKSGFIPYNTSTMLVGTDFDVSGSGIYSFDPSRVFQPSSGGFINNNFVTYGNFTQVHLTSFYFRISGSDLIGTSPTAFLKLYEETNNNGALTLIGSAPVTQTSTTFYLQFGTPSSPNGKLLGTGQSDPIKKFHLKYTPNGNAENGATYTIEDFQYTVVLSGPGFSGAPLNDVKYTQLGNQEFEIQQSKLDTQIRAKLMYTSSTTNATLVDTSNWLDYTIPLNINNGVESSHNVTFPDSPIIGINKSGTESGSMFYVEHEFRLDPTQTDLSPFYTASKFTPVDNTSTPLVYITQSATPPNDTYFISGSLNLRLGNGNNDLLSPEPISTGIVNQFLTDNTFIISNSGSTGVVSASGVFKGMFESDDVFRLGVEVDKAWKSGLYITSYSMSIFPSSSILAPINGGSSNYDSALYGQTNYGPTSTTLPPGLGNFSVPTLTDTILPGFFNAVGMDVLPFNLALDCQPLLNNYINSRESSFLFDVDYTNTLGTLTPVNQSQILEGTATKATTPDSNYEALSIITPRYLGSKSTSKLLNVWSETDTGTFGKLPTVESKNAYFAYFNSIENPYPNVNDKVKLNISSIIDEEGNALPPSLNGLSRDIFERTFPPSSIGTISIEEGREELKTLNTPHSLSDIGSYYSPIIYSQNTSNGHTNNIPLSGSGRISRYDYTTGEECLISLNLEGILVVDDELIFTIGGVSYRIIRKQSTTPDDVVSNIYYIHSSDLTNQVADIVSKLTTALAGKFNTVSNVNIITLTSVDQTNQYNDSTIEKGNNGTVTPKPFVRIGTVTNGVTPVGDQSSLINYYTFTALGTADSDLSQPVNQSKSTVDYILKPNEELIYNPPTGYTSLIPYMDTTGVTTYNNSGEVVGEDLSNKQKLKLQTSIQTSFIYDSNNKRKNNNELSIKLSLEKAVGLGITTLPFSLEDIKLNVYMAGDRVRELGSVLGEGWLTFITTGTKTTFDWRSWRKVTKKTVEYNKQNSQPILDSEGKLHFVVDNDMVSFLKSKGVYQGGGDVRYKNHNLLSLEWVITANSEDITFKGADAVRWRVEGQAKKPYTSKLPDTVFFPAEHPRGYASTKISSIGALDHVFRGDNMATAPYWVFESSLPPLAVESFYGNNILFMSSQNFNEAYGADFYQGELKYTPGPSAYFPGGMEPKGTNFEKIVYPLEIKAGDEIRFANNENYSYIIQEVTSPQNNIMGDGKGRVKLVLNKPVPKDVNKDFFLIRRKIQDASSMYLDVMYPHSYNTPVTESTSAGILFPEFPTEKLELSASSIITDLVSKGVIK